MNRQEGAAMLCSTSRLQLRLAQYVRWFTVGTIVALIGRLVIAAYHYLDYAIQAIRYPFGLEYGEGIVWQQAVMIPGKEMYGDITKYPYIVFHYPPLYHLVTRLAARAGMDWLTAGRAVSVASTGIAILAVACLIYAVSSQRFTRFASLSGALIGSLYILTQKAIIEWSPLMRVDMLAIAFSLSGLLFCIWSVRTGAYLYLAVLAFVAAVYTKQTELAAAVAGNGPFIVLRPRHAILPVLAGSWSHQRLWSHCPYTRMAAFCGRSLAITLIASARIVRIGRLPHCFAITRPLCGLSRQRRWWLLCLPQESCEPPS
jgi:hypothetical protein